MKKLLIMMVLGASAVAASAQSLQPRRTLGSRLARPAQTASQTADAAKDREARKARAAQRSQFSAGSLTTEFDRECETLFMDIVREAEICQTNLAMYATYPYWPDAMSVVSNFCEKENCVVVDVGHNFGSWKQGSWWQGRGKKAYVVRSNLETRKRFVPQRWLENGEGGFCVISRGGSYTNVAYRDVGSICCYDSDGRFVEMYDSLDKIPGMKQCFDNELKVNYAEQDRWMKAHGFAEEGSGREAENRLDAARTNVIDRLKSLRTILSSFPQWRSDNQWYGVCDVGAGMGGPSRYGESIGTRPLLGGLRRPGPRPSVNINTNDAVLVGVNERFECLGRKQDKLIEMVVRDLTGLEFGVPANTNGVLDLKFNLGSYETCAFGTSQGDVNSVTLIAEFEPSCEQKTIHEKLDQSLSTLLSAIGMDCDALTYEDRSNGTHPQLGGLRRPGGNQDWKSVQSFSQRFTISRNKQQSGEYVVTISDQRKVNEPAVNDNARQTGLLGGSLRARRLQRQQQAEADAAKQQVEQAAKDAERQAQAEQEKAQREAERAEQRQQLLAIQEELKRVREAKAAAAEALVKGTVAKGDFKARLSGIAIIEGGRMCGYEERANNAEFLSPDTPMEIPYGKAACFRVEYDFPEGYQARVWTRDRWQKGQDGSSYYFGSNPSPLYKGKGVAYGFLDMLERGKTCTLKQLAIRTNAEPMLEEQPKGWDIVVTPVNIKFHGPETAQKAPSKENEKVILNNQMQGTNSVADKLQSCDFLLNKDFKKNAKLYLCLFSASWCGPCRREMPRIAKTYAETLKDDPDIELIHFSCDQNDEKALAWAKEHDVKFPVVKPNGGNPLDLHSRGIPHLFIVKADGTLLEEGHPMRLFTDEKLRELKGGSIENAAANGEEEGSKEHAPNESFVLTGPYGIRMTGRADCKKDAEYVLKKLVDVYLPCAVRYYGDPFGGKTPSRVFTIDVQRKDGSGKGGRAGHPWGYQDGKFNIGLVKDGDRWDLAKDYYLIMVFRILTVCEEADWAGLTLYAGDFVWGDIDHDDPIPRIKEDIRKGFELARTGEKVTGLLWATRRYAPMWAALEELREKHSTLLLDYCNLKNSKYAKGELPQKISADQMVALLGEVTGVDAAAIFKKHSAAIVPSIPQGKIAVAEKLGQCDFLLNKDFKKNAKFYLCLFSASWCGPCRREMPRISKTYVETLKDDPDIELIHFSRDQNDEKALAWAKEHDVKFPVVKPNGGNPLDLHSRGIPHLFIVKADGTLVEEGHPMRIFNEEKFWEVKGSAGQPKTQSVKVNMETPKNQKSDGVQLWENGPYWAECNVGATRPEESGYYFWWGDTVGYRRDGSGWVSSKGTRMSVNPFEKSSCLTWDKGNSELLTLGYIGSAGNLLPAYDAATVHLGAPWRMPTEAEFVALVRNCDSEWTERNGVYGRLVKGRGNYASKSVFLPASGCGNWPNRGGPNSTGCYWPSTPESDSPIGVKFLNIHSRDFGWHYSCGRMRGQSIRPVKGCSKSDDRAAGSSNDGMITFTDEKFTWTAVRKDGGLCLMAASPELSGDVVLPMIGNGVEVKGVGELAFRNKSKLKTLHVPGNIKIGKSAFRQCKNLEAVTMMGGMADWYAFTGCEKLGDVFIGKNVSGLWLRSFGECTSLTNVVFEDGPTPLFLQAPFEKDHKLAKLHLPARFDGPRSNGAFSSCDNLTSLTIDAGNRHCKVVNGIVMSLDGKKVYAFATGLSSFTFPETVEEITYRATEGCNKVREFVFPDSLKVLHSQSIYECDSLESIKVGSGLQRIGGSLFYRCENLTSITMQGEKPDSAENAFGNGNAFCNGKNLKAIHVPANAKSWAGMKEWQGIPLVFDAESKK